MSEAEAQSCICFQLKTSVHMFMSMLQGSDIEPLAVDVNNTYS